MLKVSLDFFPLLVFSQKWHHYLGPTPSSGKRQPINDSGSETGENDSVAKFDKVLQQISQVKI